MTHAHTPQALPFGTPAATLIAANGGRLVPAPLLVRGRHAVRARLRHVLVVTAAVPALLLAGAGIASADTGTAHVSHSVADAMAQQEAAEGKLPCPAGTVGGRVYGSTTRGLCVPTHRIANGSSRSRLTTTGVPIIGVIMLFALV